MLWKILNANSKFITGFFYIKMWSSKFHFMLICGMVAFGAAGKKQKSFFSRSKSKGWSTVEVKLGWKIHFFLDQLESVYNFHILKYLIHTKTVHS
jgi:hypothetical protein